jgi:hypothetical protein
VIRNPHTLLIDDGQLAKNAHKTQKSDWTGGAGGRGAGAGGEGALDKNEGESRHLVLCEPRSPLWLSARMKSENSSVWRSCRGSCRRSSPGSCRRSSSSCRSYDPVQKRFLSTDATWSVVTHSSLAAAAPNAFCKFVAGGEPSRPVSFWKNTIWRKL